MAKREVASRKIRPASGQPNATTKTSFSKRVLLVCLVLIAACVLVYAPVRSFGFLVWDDPDYVVNNVHVADGLSWQGAWWALTSPAAANWHPVTWLSHMLDVQLYGMNAGPQHVTNLAIHILDSLLLFGLLYRMTGALGRSTFVAGLFAFHPLHVESVAWISERKDVLSTLFWMLTIWAYVSYVRRPRPGRYLLVLLPFGLGLMAKSMLVTLPFVLLLLDVWPLRRLPVGVNPKRLVIEKLPLFVLAAISSVVTILVQQQGGAVTRLDKFPLILRLTNAATSYVAYIGKTLWPVRLANFYPLETSPSFVPAIFGAVLLIGVTFFAIRARERYGYLFVGWFWYVGTLVPVIGLVQVGEQSMADRYTYVPLIGLFLIAAWGAPDLLARWQYSRVALPAVAACALLACATVTRAQVRYWSDDTALLRHALEATKDNYVAHDNLGYVLAAQGRTDEAIGHFTEAIRIRPNFALAQNNLGMALLSEGRLDEAARYFGEATRNWPDYVEAQNNLGRALMWQGKLDEAVLQFDGALRIRPDYAEAHDNLGRALAGQGRIGEAMGHYTEALRLRPAYAEAHNDLGEVLAMQGKLDEAAGHFADALRIKPDYAEAHENLGHALAGRGRTDEAIMQYQEALRLRPEYAEAQNDLGVALGMQGKLDEAARHFVEALRIKPEFPDASANLKMALAQQGKTGRQ